MDNFLFHGGAYESGLLVVLLVLPLTFLILVFLGRLCIEADSSVIARDDLDHLVRLKRRGVLRRLAQRIRDGLARSQREPWNGARAMQMDHAITADPDHTLHRLLRLKRRGTWLPPTRESRESWQSASTAFRE